MKKTLLIIEDDPFTQQFYSYLFPKDEFELIQTEDGNTAFEALEKGIVSLIIMDVSLKNTFYKNQKYDGLNLTHLIKKDEKFKDIPLIMITAYKKLTKSSLNFDECPADDYIVKPITDFKMFLDKVRNLVK
ncbi:MAG: response regulator [Ignavibacteria bacterium]|nr:response regulator [Ignavibacteria bacterium]